MLYVSTKQNNKAFEIAKKAQLTWAKAGHTHGTGLGYWTHKNNKFNYFKSAASAPKFYNKYFKDGIYCKNIMAHNRIRSAGGLASKDSHPFMFESKHRKDANGKPINIMSCHNGTAYSEQKLRNHLMKAGHKIYTTVDSELLAGAFAEWDTDFIKKLSDMEIGGWINILVVTDELEPKLYAYSDGSLSIHVDDEMFVIASDFTWDKTLKDTDIPSGDLIEVNLVTWETKVLYSHSIAYSKSTTTTYHMSNRKHKRNNVTTTKYNKTENYEYNKDDDIWELTIDELETEKANYKKICEYYFEDEGFCDCPVCGDIGIVWDDDDGKSINCIVCGHTEITKQVFCNRVEKDVNAKDCYLCEQQTCKDYISIYDEWEIINDYPIKTQNGNSDNSGKLKDSY